MMEMDSNPITKPSKKGTILSAGFLCSCGGAADYSILSLWRPAIKNISRQLEQGVPAQGNELAIVNLYLTSCVQYFAFAAAMVFCGKAAPKVLALKGEAPVQVTPYMLNPPAEALAPPLRKRWNRRRTMTIGKAGNFGSKTSKSGVLMQQHEGQTESRS